MKVDIPTTEFFIALQHAPGREGPYECEMLPFDRTLPFDAPDVHFRWFDGTHWSHPLDYDPDLDQEIVKPAEDHFITDSQSIAKTLAMFHWRGLVEDPNPPVIEHPAHPHGDTYRDTYRDTCRDHRSPEQIRLDEAIRNDVENIEQEKIAAGSPMDVQWKDDDEL